MTVKQQQQVDSSSQDVRIADFAQHIEEANVDFKETIMKKVHTLKLKDTAELNHKVNQITIIDLNLIN